MEVCGGVEVLRVSYGVWVTVRVGARGGRIGGGNEKERRCVCVCVCVDLHVCV